MSSCILRTAFFLALTTVTPLAALAQPAAEPRPPAPPQPSASAAAAANTPKEEARALFMEGVTLTSQGDAAGALVKFQKSREIYPTMAATRNIAVCLHDLKRYKEARAIYELLLREYPSMSQEDTTEVKRAIVELDALIPAEPTTEAPTEVKATDPQGEPYIKRPGAHRDSRVEISLLGHLNLLRNRAYGGGGVVDAAGVPDTSYHPEGGGGVRATIEIVDPVIPGINNTLGLTVGLDVTNCAYCASNSVALWPSLTAQWNFFFSKSISVFPEVGIMVRGDGPFRAVYPDVMAAAGLRYHFTDWMTANIRVGVPFASAGVSFFAP